MTRFARLGMYQQPELSPLDRGINGYEITHLDCYDIPAIDLTEHDVLIVQSTIDQDHLARHRSSIRQFLEAGGVLIYGGHLHRDWLPGAAPFVPVAKPSLAAYRIAEVADHPVFAGISAEDLCFRRGVAGFFARGQHAPPDGAEVLARLSGGEAVTYIDRVTTPGTILLQATCDLVGYGDGLEGPVARLTTQVLDWAAAEAREQRRPRQPGLAAVHSGSSILHRALTTGKYAQHLDGGLIYLPDLATADLSRYRGIILPERMHPGLIADAAPNLLRFLDSGGTLVAFSGGEPLPGFLPGVTWQHRPTNYWWWREPGASLGLWSPEPEHSLFDHVGIRDCTWHYHGVLEPPEGAQALVALPTGEALLYIDTVSTAGTLIVSTLDPLSHFGGYFMPATERFLDGFIPWLAQHTTTAGAPA
ncbi:hypothetical protein HT102_01430 [Hoyosella sp. G463]|uniref:Uncharacterized protein n=1 Tax=Lolliginicoccus lacisalsi TaxID=2742202 RepID=A0A927JB28_9ACTN|nr:hypothetical protein [Lolliginicoccus lacisalsi]MBD8505152.1 hypothetical protein [Lolliginicoccus lacisalsi]